MRKSVDDKLFWILFAGALALVVLYALAFNAYYVGFFNDDAFYIIGARSFAQGHYSELNQPGMPPLVDYLPGYPLLLAPIAFFFPSSLIAFQVFSIVLSTATIGLLLIYFRRKMSVPVLIATLTVCAVNPLMLSLSATVLSDIPYLFFTILILIASEKLWDKENASAWVGLSALAAFAFHLRAVGLAFPLSIGAALLFERRWKELGFFGIGSAVFIPPFFIRNFLLSQEVFHYGNELLGISPHTHLLGNSFFYIYETFGMNLFRLPDVMGPDWAGITLAGIAIAFFLVGFFVHRHWPLGQNIGIYLFFYLGTHLLWSKQSTRYVLPVFFLVAALFFIGVEYVSERWLRKKTLVWVALGTLLFLYAWPVRSILTSSLFLRTRLNTPPENTIAWVKTNTRPEDLFVSEIDGQFYLLTGRQTFHFPKLQTKEELIAWIRAKKVSYAILQSTDMVLKTPNARTPHDPLPTDLVEALLTDRALFVPVFRDTYEKVFIAKVR